MSRALCKFRGMLVIAEVRPSRPGSPYRRGCPECHRKEFWREHGGWMECECGFAILTTDYDRVMGEPPEGLTGEALPNIIPMTNKTRGGEQ